MHFTNLGCWFFKWNTDRKEPTFYEKTRTRCFLDYLYKCLPLELLVNILWHFCRITFLILRHFLIRSVNVLFYTWRFYEDDLYVITIIKLANTHTNFFSNGYNWAYDNNSNYVRNCLLCNACSWNTNWGQTYPWSNTHSYRLFNRYKTNQ